MLSKNLKVLFKKSDNLETVPKNKYHDEHNVSCKKLMEWKYGNGVRDHR